MMKFHTVALLSLLFFSGCAYKSSMKRADELAYEGQWRAAVTQYEVALAKKPDDPRALSGLDKVRAPAIAAALEQGKRELAQDQHENAMAQVDYINHLVSAHTDAAALEQDIKDVMALTLEKLMDQQQMERAYAFAGRIKALFPDRPYLDAAYLRIRTHFLAKSTALRATGDYADAIAVLGIISTHEPAQVSAMQQTENTIRFEWADSVLVHAKAKSKAGATGAAASLYARAWEIASRQADLALARQHVARLAADGTFTIKPQTTGDVTRSNTLRRAVEGVSKTISGGQLSNASPRLAVGLAPDFQRCTQAYTTRVATQRYISGQRVYDNPDYLLLADQLHHLRPRRDHALIERESAFQAFNTASAEWSNYERSVMQPIWQEIAHIRSDMQRTQIEVNGAKSMLAELENDLAQAEADGASDQVILAFTLSIGGQRQRLNTAQSQMALHSRHLEEEQQHEARDAYGLVQRRATMDAAQSHQQSTNARFQSLDSEQNTLNQRIQQTPRQLSENVYANFNYNIFDYTRTCDVAVTVVYNGQWNGGWHKQVRYDQGWTATDSTNKAFRRYGVVADPLAYTTSDTELIRLSDEAIGKTISSGITAYANEFYAAAWRNGVADIETHPDRASDALLSVYLGAPGRMDTNRKQLLINHLNAEYGLGTLETLLVTSRE